MTRLPAVVTTFGLVATACSAALAQLPPAAPAPGPTPPAARPLFFEVMIVVALLGLSLFVVCRSSRRN